MIADRPHTTASSCRVSCRWLRNRRIALFKGKGEITPDSIDKWGRAVLDTIRHWPPEQPYLVLIDLPLREDLLPHFEQWIGTVLAASAHLDGHYGVVSPTALTGDVLDTLARVQEERGVGTLTGTVFTSDQAAIAAFDHLL